MTTLLTTDETSGVQNVEGSITANDIDILSGGVTFPVEFSTALAAVTNGGGLPSTAALSGYGTATTADDNVATFSGTVIDVGFTLTGGNGVDSGLMTTDGTHIFLYVYSGDNNVVLAREGTAGGLADPNGALAFAAYLDTQTPTVGSDAGATAARLWLVQYQALKHPDGTDANDIVYLSGKLNVAVTSPIDFSLEGAPSGQNLFLMFGDGSPTLTDTTIVVTGKNPANQSDGASITTGDTVNSGQGGGGTTLGSNNQMIDPNEGMYFTFVKGANTNYTVPNLDQNEADVEANIDFTNLFGATAASFDVVQLQPPKGATLLLTASIAAVSNDKGTSTVSDDTPYSGVNFIDHLHDNTLVNITSVTVTRTEKVGKDLVTTDYNFLESDSGTWSQDGITLDFSGNTAKITGVEQGDRVHYHTATEHDRLLVDNVGNTTADLNSAFDIGAFKLETGTVTTTPLADLAFVDDAPTAAAALGAGAVVHDETVGNDLDANDTTSATVIALFSGVTTTSSQMSAGYAQGTAAVIDSSGSTGGADGLAGTVYSLAVSAAGVDSGLDTTDGHNILLYKEGDLVVGRISGGTDDGKAAFAVEINSSTGVLSVAQYNSIHHPTGGTSYDESASISSTALLAVATVTDGDGDTNAASVGIGAHVSFQDDGPTASAALGTGSVAHDETAGIQADANDTTSASVISLFSGVTTTSSQMSAGYAQGSASVVDSSASTGGVDGLASTAYSLAVSAAGVDSGLDTVDGHNILLYKEGALVVGRISGGTNDGKAAFAVQINAGTGVLSVAQYNAIHHPTGGGSSYDESLSIDNAALLAVATVTDGDSDTNAASVGIGAKVSFQDDGPSLAFGNVIGTGAIDPQYGYWNMAPGVDGLAATGLDISLDAFHLVKPDSTLVTGTSFTFSETAPSPDGTGAYHWTGSLTGDFDNNAATADTTENFTLTAYTAGTHAGTYAIDLVEGFKSTIVTSTAGGSLGSGGPDPVQTLTLVGGTEQVVFFAVDPTADASGTTSIASAIQLGAPDYNEATLQQKSSMADSDGISANGNQPGDGTYPFINDTYAMNVSTSGIGVNNNVLQGDSSAAITTADESFVINPQTLLTAMKVFIDNSVGGYNPATEDLYYRTYYSDGTFGSLTEVNTLTSEAGGQVSFTIQREGSKLIDAVQLVMGRGDVKVPVIQFITETNNPSDGIKLDFTANIADGDGDTASSSFVTNLAANALGTSFDYVLNGIASKADAFDVDLAPTENKYQVNGFETGADKLVLLGANSYTIDNSGANSIVDVTETAGGQHTIVTVVGVDLVAADIATIV